MDDPLPRDLAGEDENDDDDDAFSPDDAILSLLFAGSSLGAACYHLSSASLQVVADVDDVGPEFNLTKALLHQVNPRRVLVSSRQSSPDFLKVVKAVCGVGCDEEDQTADAASDDSLDDGEVGVEATYSASTTSRTTTTTTRTSAPTSARRDGLSGTTMTTTKDSALRDTQLVILSGRDFAYPGCKSRILGLRLPQERGRDVTEDDHFILVNDLINLNNESCVRATGALLKHLDTGGAVDEGNDDQPSLTVLSIRNLVIEDFVRIDVTTFSALQIFNPTWQPSGSRCGSWNKQREGFSLFGVLNRCKSVLGTNCLRHMCRCLPRSPSAIEMRQAAVEFFADPTHRELAKYLQDCIGRVKNTPIILKRLATSQGSVKDWKRLARALEGLLLICRACEHHIHVNLVILQNFRDCSTQELQAMSNFITRIMDFEGSGLRNQFTVNSGVDDDLDEKRRLHNGLPDLLLRVAEEEINDLPDFIDECVMIYVPQIGYMLAVQPWADDLEEKDFLDFPDLQFMFRTNNVPHFKSRRCKELDDVLGDTAMSIAEFETAIVVRLTNYVLAHSDHLLAPTRCAAMLDCLLALASVAAENADWCRPQLIPGALIDIKGGRHPLQEVYSKSFVPNPTVFEEGKKMIILTGPNACGKSVYLKQVGLIVFLAHLGSFVPAQSAVLPIVDQIYTRILTVESLSLGLSAFAVDLNQGSILK